jgi:BT1 family
MTVLVKSNETNSVTPGVHRSSGPSAPNESDTDNAAREAYGIEMRPLTKLGTGEDAEHFDDEIIDSVMYHRLDENKPWNLEDFLFPPEMPRQCQLLRPENIAIPFSYLLVGILSGLYGPWINVYPLDLGATEAQQTTLGSIKSLPASFKLIFGFISDNFPIAGYRRKSYMLIGWTVTAASMSYLFLFSNLSLLEEVYLDDNGNEATRTVAPDDAPSVPLLSLVTLLFGTGFWMADVMADSVVAEKAKLEPIHSRGSIQSSCYSYRFFGLMVAAPFSTTLYSSMGPRSIIALLALLPLSVLPMVYMLGEVRYAPVASTREQCGEIWRTVCSRAVWQPLGFVYLYNVLQVGNGAWREYLRTVLGFTATQLNYIYIASCVLLYVGIITYKYYLIKFSWRFVYIVTTLLNGIFSVLQVLLILGITFGLSNFWFALGDDAFTEFIQGIQFLPTTIMMVHLTPAGSEGASYAMFTTVNNSALNLSVALSTHLLGWWDVSKEALANNELTGMINLTYLTTAMQVSGILFVGLLPRTKEELFELKEKAIGSSSIGGFFFLAITFLSIMYATFVGVMNIVNPGWSGES